MPGTFDSTGLSIQTFDEILAELQEAIQGPEGIGPTVFVGREGPLGQLLAIVADREVDLQELAQGLYDAFNVDVAQGIALDNLVALVGLERLPATEATGAITATGTPGTVLAVGRIVRKSVTLEQFVTTVAATIVAVTAWAAGTPYVVGDRRTASGNVYIVVDPGTSGGAAPSGTGSGIVDGGVIWDFVGVGTGAVDATAASEEAGEFDALARTIDEIVTPVAGWQTAVNLADFTEGTAIETDAELRERREASLQLIGGGADGAIRAAVLALEFVRAAICISNRELTTDGNGIPGKAFRVVVWPSTLSTDENETIAKTIFERMPAGIKPDGTQTFSVVDQQNFPHTVRFSFASAVPIYVIVNLIDY